MSKSAPSLPPLALIAGPTASGKSALACALAEAIGGVIINADSTQVYADLRIVSARPSPAEEARATHRLYGVRDGADPWSAAGWAEAARMAIAGAHAAGRVPILVGGTGLYLRTLLDGIAPVPPIDPDVRSAVRALGTADAYAALRTEDPAAATRLRPSDTSRIARALEVARSTGRLLAAWQEQRSGGLVGEVALSPLVLLPPRDWLYRRCDYRFAGMMGDEGLAEVARLIARKLAPALPVMRAIGVPEIAAFLAGISARHEALAAGQAATRRYVKRQYTWFRHQPPAAWPRWMDALDEPLAALREFRLP